MTLAAAPSKVILSGDGSTTAFSYTFAINSTDGSDIVVSIADNASPPNITVLSSNYSVDINNKHITYPTVGGVAPLAAGVNALPAGWQIILQRIEPVSQNVQLSDQNTINFASVEAELDKITMILQQLSEQIGRCLQYPVNVVPSAAQLNPSNLTVSITPLIATGTLAQLKAKAQLAPTVQFLCLATDLGTVGQFGFYIGNTTVGDMGFFFMGGA